jgi:hypothetical protein
LNKIIPEPNFAYDERGVFETIICNNIPQIAMFDSAALCGNFIHPTTAQHLKIPTDHATKVITSSGDINKGTLTVPVTVLFCGRSYPIHTLLSLRTTLPSILSTSNKTIPEPDFADDERGVEADPLAGCCDTNSKFRRYSLSVQA